MFITNQDRSIYEAPFGRYNCDPPYSILETFLKLIGEEEIDILLVPGDFVGHFIAGDPFDAAYGDRDILKKILFDSSSLLHEKFKNNVIVVPTLGNNDYWYHD